MLLFIPSYIRLFLYANWEDTVQSARIVQSPVTGEMYIVLLRKNKFYVVVNKELKGSPWDLNISVWQIHNS